MGALCSNLLAAAIVFASTNLDDLLVVTAAFTEPEAHWPTIVVSQFVGIGFLVLLSAALALTTLGLPKGAVAYLGAIPLLIGTHRLWKTSAACVIETARSESRRTSTPLLTLILATVSTGGDNLTVYVPLFAQAPQHIPAYAMTFSLLTGIWCIIGYRLVRHRALGACLRQFGPSLLPIVMIAVGLSILSDIWR